MDSFMLLQKNFQNSIEETILLLKGYYFDKFIPKMTSFYNNKIIRFMNNFSDKDLLPIQDLIQNLTFNKQSDSQDSKTRTSIPSISSSSANQIGSVSQNEAEVQERDQITTISTQVNLKNVLIDNSHDQGSRFSQLKSLTDCAIFHQGFILRKQKCIISSWEKRFIVLTKGKLFFFENELKNHLMGCIYIKYLPVSIIENEDTFQLSASDGGQTIVLKGQNKFQHLNWFVKLDEVISFCKNEQKVSIRKFNLSVYQQKDFALQEQFIKNSQTGDLLLVSSDTSASYLQKFLTHSQFNHVAMIVRFQDQVKIFQANQDDGVFIYDWKQYLQTFKDHRRFAWRKLIYPNKFKYEDKLKQLIKKYIGRSYSLSSARLLRRTSHDSDEQDDREFFCSQVVAKIYKSLGLLDKNISSVRYWPISFTSRGQLNLNDGAYFSLQKNILLSKHLRL